MVGRTNCAAESGPAWSLASPRGRQMKSARGIGSALIGEKNASSALIRQNLRVGKSKGKALGQGAAVRGRYHPDGITR